MVTNYQQIFLMAKLSDKLSPNFNDKIVVESHKKWSHNLVLNFGVCSMTK